MCAKANDFLKKHLLSMIALLLFASWWVPKQLNPHLSIDHFLAKALQSPLRLYPYWQIICAYLNTDLFDGAMYAAIAVHTAVAFSQVPLAHRKSEFKRFLLYYLLLSSAQYAFKYLLHSGVHWNRLSPSLTLNDAFRIDPSTISVYFKDSSRRSFPGDHSLFLFSWAMFWVRSYSKGIASSALLIASLFSLPRLFVGGHWLSDMTLGGILPSWVFAHLTLQRGQKGN